MRNRPTDPDVDVELPMHPVGQDQPVSKKFNPTPDAWRDGNTYATGSPVAVQVWCRYDRQMEVWVPHIFPESLVMVKLGDEAMFADLKNVSVKLEQQTLQQGMVHLDLNVTRHTDVSRLDYTINFLEWLDAERIVVTWRDVPETHEDVAKAYLEARGQ